MNRQPASENSRPHGMVAQLRKSMSRRHALALLGGAAGTALVVGCGSGAESALMDEDTDTGSGTDTGTSSSSGSCTVVAEETNGPFPADGSNTNNGVVKNVFTDSRAFRTDIRSDFDGNNVQTGTPFEFTITLLDANGNCEPLSGYYIYVWHCSRTGSYSQYSGNMNGGNYADNTWLRGVGQTDANGQVTFTTIFPGRYSGRATHIHFEVYPDGTPEYSEVIATSQLAFPESVTDSVYTNTTLYPNSAANDTENEDDNIFSDGTDTEMLTVSGNNSDGYTASITVAVSA